MHEEIHFNQDWSGTIKYTFDLTEMAETMREEGFESLMDDDLTQKLKEPEDMHAASYVIIDEDLKKGLCVFGYDFKNVEVLNATMSDSNPLSSAAPNGEVFDYFVLKGKKLFFQIPPMNEGEERSEEEESMMMMADMLHVKFTLFFDRQIKKVKEKTSLEEIDIYDRNVTWEPDTGDLMYTSEPQGFVVIVK